MKKTEQTLKMLRFAHRARKLTFGMSGTLNSLKKGKTNAIILANDLAQNAENKLKPLLSKKRTPIFRCGTKKQLGDFFGREELGIIGVGDASFAKAIQKIYNGTVPEIFQQKKEIRSRIEQQRKSLSKSAVESKSSQIIALLSALPECQNAQTIHCYVAWRNEVDTHDFIKTSLKSGKRVVVPVTDLQNHLLRHSEIRCFDDLRPGAFGILEPASEHFREVTLGEIDLVIVPGVAFDQSGHRLGFGGGYYDAFLAKVKATKVALAYEFQIVHDLPTRPEDEMVDLLVSEKDIYSFTRL